MTVVIRGYTVSHPWQVKVTAMAAKAIGDHQVAVDHDHDHDQKVAVDGKVKGKRRVRNGIVLQAGPLVVRANPPEEDVEIINEDKIRTRIIIIPIKLMVIIVIMISMMMILTTTITTTLMMRGIKRNSILFMHPMIAAIKIDLDWPIC
jgi:hypothetical protein